MTGIYHRLFYHVYKSLLKTQGKGEAILTALMIMSFLIGINFMLINLILDILGFDIIDSFSKIKYRKIYIVIFLYCVNGYQLRVFHL